MRILLAMLLLLQSFASKSQTNTDTNLINLEGFLIEICYHKRKPARVYPRDVFFTTKFPRKAKNLIPKSFSELDSLIDINDFIIEEYFRSVSDTTYIPYYMYEPFFEKKIKKLLITVRKIELTCAIEEISSREYCKMVRGVAIFSFLEREEEKTIKLVIPKMITIRNKI